MTDANPLSPVIAKVRTFVGSVVAIATFANVLALFYLSPSAFQSLGTVWISVAILLFASWRFFAHQLMLGFQGRGLAVEQVEEFLDKASIRESKGWLNYITKDGREIDNPPTYTEDHVEGFLAEITDAIDGIIFGPELALLIVGTLQTGYGAALSTFVQEIGMA